MDFDVALRSYQNLVQML